MIATQLLNTLVVEGFQLKSDGENLELTGPRQRLTSELRQAIRDNKTALVGLLQPSYEAAEREAIRWADTPEADVALEEALADWDSLPIPPNACSKCGSSLFRWDIHRNRHCVACNPGQSERVRRLAESIRERTGNTQQIIHNKASRPRCGYTLARFANASRASAMRPAHSASRQGQAIQQRS